MTTEGRHQWEENKQNQDRSSKQEKISTTQTIDPQRHEDEHGKIQLKYSMSTPIVVVTTPPIFKAGVDW